jgi:hypothetical protein
MEARRVGVLSGFLYNYMPYKKNSKPSLARSSLLMEGI